MTLPLILNYRTFEISHSQGQLYSSIYHIMYSITAPKDPLNLHTITLHERIAGNHLFCIPMVSVLVGIKMSKFIITYHNEINLTY